MKKSIVTLAMLLIAQLCAYAVDGQVLINQATLNASGGTYTINNAGSYKLSGNLLAKDANTDVIVIAADHVTIDLNGFAILGPSNCSGGFPCVNFGFGAGIITVGRSAKNDLPFFNITIRNGTIQGMGVGISLNGDSILVEYLHVRSNSFEGISIYRTAPQSSVIVQHNNVQQNASAGISIFAGIVEDNVISESGSDGIFIQREGTVARNFVRGNQGNGLNITNRVNYIGNSIWGNALGTVTGGGINQGQNLCNGASCPNAVF